MSCFSGFEAPVRHVFELFEGRTEQFQKCEYLSLKCFLSFKTVDDLWYISHPNPGACVPWELDEFVAQNPQEFIRCFEYIVVFTIMVNIQSYLSRADPEQNESAKRGLVERLVLLAEDPGERQHVQLHIRLPRLRRRGQELLVKGAACLIPSWRVGLGRQSEMLNIKHSKVCTLPPCVWVCCVNISTTASTWRQSYKSGISCSFSTRAILQLPVTLFSIERRH